MGEDEIAILRPGETVGPFEIVIPRELVFLEEFTRRTTRWERLLLRTKVMRKRRRRALYERFRPWFDRHGWDT
jgi:hypothetical protein